MANENFKVDFPNDDGSPMEYTVASGTAIAKYTLLKLTTPRTAIISSGVTDPCVGIALMDKDGTDYSTTITVWTDGRFSSIASGAITIGAPLISAGEEGTVYGTVKVAIVADASGASIIGYALEAVNEGQRFIWRMRL